MAVICTLCLSGLGALLVACAPNDTEFSIVSYNVHNFFDDVDDGTEFSGYRPGSDNWGRVQFHTKAERIAEAVRGTGGYPDILALQEIENEHALSVLLSEYLPRGGYRWYAMPPHQPAAFRVALVTRFPVTGARVHALFFETWWLRDILEVELAVDGHPLSLFVNHWPSRRGGAEQTESARLFAAGAVRRRLDVMLASNPDAAVVVTGDFNMEPHELAASGVLEVTDLPGVMLRTVPGRESGAAGSIPSDAVLYNGWAKESFPGSYFFRGVWSRIDQMLFSAGAVGSSVADGGFRLDAFSVISEAAYLDLDGAPRAWRPGSRWGYSDHLPIRATMRLTR